jgi:hypothetical protein
MNKLPRLLLGMAVIGLGIILCTKSPDASSVHFVVANDGTVARAL